MMTDPDDIHYDEKQRRADQVLGVTGFDLVLDLIGIALAVVVLLWWKS